MSNETYKIASKMIMDLQDRNIKLRSALIKLIQICDNTKQHLESEVWMQHIGYAKQMLNETDVNNLNTHTNVK